MIYHDGLQFIAKWNLGMDEYQELMIKEFECGNAKELALQKRAIELQHKDGWDNEPGFKDEYRKYLNKVWARIEIKLDEMKG